MKKIILILLLFTGVIYSQGNQPDRLIRRSEVMPMVKDSLGYASVKSYGAVGDSLTDDTQAFQNAIDANDKVFVPAGVYTVDSLVLHSNSVLFGNGNSSKICLKSTGTVLLSAISTSFYLTRGNISGVRISNLWLSGLDEGAFAYANPIGTRVGIRIDGADDFQINSVYITGFDLAAIIGNNTNGGGSNTTALNVSNCRIESNYYGLWIKDLSEYGFFANNSIQWYNTGINLVGGNNTFIGNQVTNGVYGLYMDKGTNDSHGSITGGAFNHNTYAMYFDSVYTTENISNLNIWYGAIVFHNSVGVKIMNSTVMSDSIVFEGGSCVNSGFLNCTFDDNILEIYRDKETDQSIMKNNNFWGALTGTNTINDIDITPYEPNINGLPSMEYNKVDSSYTEIADNNDIDFGIQDFSIEWFGYIKPDGTFQSIVTKENTTTVVGYTLGISSDDVLYFDVKGTDLTQALGQSPTLSEGYYHIVATKQDTNLAFYINGDSLDELSRPLLTKAVAFYDYSGASISNTGDLKLGVYGHTEIGTYFPQYLYNGGMNLVRLYNFAVSSAQAKNMFTSGLPNLSEVPYKYKWGNQDSLTSGTLELGKTYIIDNWITGDDFTNVGGTNADSSIFTATGTTPTTWTNSSIVRKLGCVAEYRAENSGVATWEDNSANNLDGTNTNVTPNYSTYIIALPDTAGITTGFIPKRQADGSIEWEADAGGTGGGTVTSVAALTLGTTGTDLSSTVANGTTTPVITLQVPTASATNRGALSSTDWSTFNNKPDSDAVNGLIGDWADSTASDTSAYTMDEIDSLLALVGKVQTHTITTDSTLAASLMYGGIFYVTEAQTITLPAVAEGMNATFITVGNVAVSIDVNGSDLMYLDGTALSDGDKATNTSTTGDMIVFTYFSSVGWYATSGSNDGDRWTDGN